MTEADILAMVSKSQEFQQIKVRSRSCSALICLSHTVA